MGGIRIIAFVIAFSTTTSLEPYVSRDQRSDNNSETETCTNNSSDGYCFWPERSCDWAWERGGLWSVDTARGSGDAGSIVSGADIEWDGLGTVTLSWDRSIEDVPALWDIDG